MEQKNGAEGAGNDVIATAAVHSNVNVDQDLMKRLQKLCDAASDKKAEEDEDEELRKRYENLMNMNEKEPRNIHINNVLLYSPPKDEIHDLLSRTKDQLHCEDPPSVPFNIVDERNFDDKFLEDLVGAENIRHMKEITLQKKLPLQQSHPATENELDLELNEVLRSINELSATSTVLSSKTTNFDLRNSNRKKEKEEQIEKTIGKIIPKNLKLNLSSKDGESSDEDLESEADIIKRAMNGTLE